ncbi:MAG: DUF3106 domain-containing protein [Arenicellales bacterium]|jgi:hypothetical protein
MKVRSLKGLIVILALAGLEPVQAQDNMAPMVQPEQWQRLSPDTRNEMRREYLQSLSPNKREELRTQVKRFHAMSQSKKQELCRRFKKDRGYLPPTCQKLF